ncbi:MAG: hypothetical protein BWX70_01560 [Verrucomicrobia bacterium ADurb.Bin070]|nr:MAG: hypothetical protein BWX70_01560 [Verrucomicrobia bacterium ADurb.Bin070]
MSRLAGVCLTTAARVRFSKSGVSNKEAAVKQVSRRQAMAAMGAAGTCACGLNAGCATFSKKGHASQIAREAYTIDGQRKSG